MVSFEILTLFLYLKGNAAAARGDVEEANRLSRTTRGLVIASLVFGNNCNRNGCYVSIIVLEKILLVSAHISLSNSLKQ